MAEKQINLDIVINTADAARSTREIKQSIKELNDEILKADEGSEAFIRASKKAGELKDKLEDAKDSIKSFNASPIENITNSFGSLGNKLKSLDFGGAKQEFSNLSVSLKEGVTSLGAMIPGLANASKGMQAFGGAIAATGIGALVISIVLLITNFDKLKEAGGTLGKALTNIGDLITGLVTDITDFSDAIGLTNIQANKLADEGLKKVNDQLKNINDGEETYLEYLEKSGASEKTLYENRVKYSQDREAQFNKELKLLQDKANIDGKLSDEEQLKIAEVSKKIGDEQTKRLIYRLDYDKKIKEADDKKDAEDKAKADKKAAEDKAKNDKLIADTKRLQDDLAKLKLSEIKDDEARAIATAKYERDKALATAVNAEQRLIIEKTYQEQLKLISLNAKEDFVKTEKDKTKEILEKRKEANDIEISLLQAKIDKEKKLEQERLQAKIDLANSFAATITSLNENLNSNFLTGIAGLSEGIGQFLELSKQNFDSTTEQVAAYAQVALGVVSNVLSGIQQNNQQKLQESLAESQATTEQLIADEQNKLNQGLISQSEFDKQKQQIEFKAKQKEYELKKKAFEDDKKLKTAQTIVAGLQGAVSAFAGAMQLGPIAGPIVGGILAAAIAAMTAVNVSKIQSTKFGEAAPVMPTDAAAAAGAAGAAIGGTNPPPSPVVNDFTAFGTGGQANNIMANQPVVQAVVVESQITATQLKLAGYKQNAELSDFGNKG